MPKWPWIERTFHLDFPITKFPDLLERWRGTPARLDERVGGLPRELLVRRPPKGWSIQENVGHLLDIEFLPARRIEQVLAGEPEMIPADMSNRKTIEANHNEADIADLLRAFRSARMATIQRLEGLEESEWGKSAMHARTGLRMRIVDIVHFISEHDDYHLGRIGELIRMFG
jgi:uncharacterized damage-inducible protein DinB